MRMKTLEPDAERDQLLREWGDATAALCNAYLDAMPTAQRDLCEIGPLEHSAGEQEGLDLEARRAVVQGRPILERRDDGQLPRRAPHERPRARRKLRLLHQIEPSGRGVPVVALAGPLPERE